MSSVVKKAEVAKMLPRRDPHSHKGQNGRVLVIGGSLEYFGAPILASLAALNSGSDLVYLLVPQCNFEVSRSYYPDLIVRTYPGNCVNSRTLDSALPLLPLVDVVLIGPGVGENPESLRVITRIIEKASCQVVLDAEAIPALVQRGIPSSLLKAQSPRITITPHRGEMSELMQGPLPEDQNELIRIAEDFAERWHVTILLKSAPDSIVSPGRETRLNRTGNAGMTVGGTGDVLAGLTASLIAPHLDPYEACQCAAFINGQTGDNLYRTKGYNFIATDVALELPYSIKALAG